ncbi:BATH-38 protein [Aphelenchoides avenae]|nr:BATH-38 protein [Aphelenchus avenae]
MLTGNFKEGHSDQVPIKQTSAEDFVTFMRAIALVREPVTDANVQVLYSVADVYGVEFLRRDCEKHLMATEGIEAIDKLLLAQSLNKTDFITRLVGSLSHADLEQIADDAREDELLEEVKEQLCEREKYFSDADSEQSSDSCFGISLPANAFFDSP